MNKTILTNEFHTPESIFMNLNQQRHCPS